MFHGHNGAVLGGLTEMAYLPGYGRGYAVMINSGSGKALRLIADMLRHYVIRDLIPPALPPARRFRLNCNGTMPGIISASARAHRWAVFAN